MLKPYTVIDHQWIKLIEGPFTGIMYRYGKVQLIEEQNQLRIRFEYEVDPPCDLGPDFESYIGPTLGELIEDGVINNSIVYTGGVDV